MEKKKAIAWIAAIVLLSEIGAYLTRDMPHSQSERKTATTDSSWSPWDHEGVRTRTTSNGEVITEHRK